MIGSTISHYQILEKLGEGGMGVVYKARDTKLNRTVALKFLPSHMSASEQDKARFKQEAQAAAALNHPNICTIFGIEESDEHLFIAMEYVDGMTLRRKIAAGTMQIAESIQYASQIGEALQEAHSKGIVHRDVKPDNIMVNSRNQIKVMDFGLAKLKGTLKLTRSSSTVGTLAYMPPEQIQGGEVDARSDIFSFGVVLFEMLSGRMPFRGEHEAAMMYSIVNEEPESILKFRPDTSSEVEHILRRALEKDPEDRYQNVHDVLIDLRRLKKETSKVSRRFAPQNVPPVEPSSQSISVPPVAEAPPPTATVTPTTSVTINIPRLNARSMMMPVAVLGTLIVIGAALYFLVFNKPSANGERVPIVVADFINETREPELDGLSGMLITALEQSRRLDVLPRVRMFDILRQLGRGNVERVDEELGKVICNQAGIHSLLIASVRKFGKVYTVDMKMIDPADGKYLFTATETGEGQESIPALLDKLSQKTREGFKETRTEIQSSRNVADVTTTNMQAYQHFFQGEQLMNRVRFLEAQDEYLKAMALDSTFGLAYYRLAYAIGWDLGGEEKARPYIKKALALLDRIPEKERYLVQALDAQLNENFAAGIAILKEMEKIFPNEKEMLYNIGDWSYHDRKMLVAQEYLEKALAMDPTMERAVEHLCWTYRDTEQHDKFLEMAKKYVTLSGSDEAYSLLGTAYRRKGDYAGALQTLKQLQQLFPKIHGVVGQIAQTYMDMGDYAQAELESRALIEDGQPIEARTAGYAQLSHFYPLVGKYREALRALDRRIDFFWQAKDTGGAAMGYAMKAFYRASAGQPLEEGLKELERVRAIESRVIRASYWGYKFLFAAQTKNQLMMENIKSFPEPLFARAIILLSRRDCAEGERLVDSLRSLSGFWRTILYSYLAECQFIQGRTDDAIQSYEMIGKIADYEWGFKAVFYPKSLYQLGLLHEKKGNKKLAIEHYEKLLALWKNADENLPELVDAKARLAKLRGVASK